MTRLYWRIFLVFWTVIVLTTIVTVSINSIIYDDDVANSRRATMRATLDALAEQAQSVLDAGGPQNLYLWLRSRQVMNPRPPLLIIGPDGREMLGRPMAGRRGQLTRKTQQQLVARTRQMELISPNGDRYIMFVPRVEPRFGEWLLSPRMRAMFPVILVLISGFACLLLARYLTRPIRVFRAAGQQIAVGDLSARVGATVAARSDEFGALAKDFNHMADRIQLLIDSQQRLLRDVSHELRTPLARLQAAVGLIRQNPTNDIETNLARIEREGENLDVLIGQILNFARLQSLKSIDRGVTDLGELVAEVVSDARFEGQTNQKDIIFQEDKRFLVNADEPLIRSAIENVIRNALLHCRSQTVVTLAQTDRSDRVSLTIEDDGPGADESDIRHLFEPFYTARSGGVGIGLAIAHRAVELHDGKISAQNGLTHGLVIRIELPTIINNKQ
jgi:signal transduction histidine kinase